MVWHVLPNNDTHPHEETTICECDPEIINQNGNMIVVHNSFDGREGIEWSGEVLKQSERMNNAFDKLLGDNYRLRELTTMSAETNRRNRLDLMHSVEKMITETKWELEKVGADVRLTEATILLSRAKDLISDYLDMKKNSEI